MGFLMIGKFNYGTAKAIKSPCNIYLITLQYLSNYKVKAI